MITDAADTYVVSSNDTLAAAVDITRTQPIPKRSLPRTAQMASDLTTSPTYLAAPPTPSPIPASPKIAGIYHYPIFLINPTTTTTIALT